MGGNLLVEERAWRRGILTLKAFQDFAAFGKILGSRDFLPQYSLLQLCSYVL